MNVRLFCVLILGATIFGICNVSALDTTEEEEARMFVKDASKKLFAHYDKLAANTLESEDEDMSNYFNVVNIDLGKSDVSVDIAGNATLFAQTKFKDAELNYILNKLQKSSDESILGREKYFYILRILRHLEILAADKDIESYKNKTIELSYFPDVQNIFATSNDPDELKYYWNEWRERNDIWAMSNFLVLVNITKDTAQLTGLSAYQFWMKDFNMTQMDAVMTQIEPVYRQMHGFLRHQLNKKYGNPALDTKGPIPDHLFQQVLAQVWTSGSVIDEFFPRNELPNFNEILAKSNYDTVKMFKTASKFYESLGFGAIPESYWGTRLKMRSSEDKGDCKAKLHTESSSVSMRYCHKMDFRTFMQAHGYMARIHCALEKTDLPAYYFNSYDLDHAVGEAVILSASSPKHLAQLGITSDPEFTEEVFMNRLMRLSIHTLLNIPIYYVHTKAMANLFEGKVEMTELNKHYWELMDKYVGVGPPVDRVNNSFDFPFKFYLELNKNEQARKFNSEVLSYQIYMKLCSIADQYPKGHLQNCDFYGSKDVGDVLKKMIKPGSSKPIHEVLATLLPEDPKLNAEGLVEYFFPALSWLTVANQQNNVNIGWTHTEKKIGSVKLPIVE